MTALVSSLLAIIALILEVVVQQKKQREAKTYDNDVRRFDEALARRDADRLSVQFDELRLPGAPGQGDPGGPDDQDAAGR